MLTLIGTSEIPATISSWMMFPEIHYDKGYGFTLFTATRNSGKLGNSDFSRETRPLARIYGSFRRTYHSLEYVDLDYSDKINSKKSVMAKGGDMSGRRDNLIVGLDIGTTKICAIVGNLTEEGLDIVGIGTSPSRGLRKGVVINIESTVASIKKAVEEAELMAGCEIKSVYAGIAGGHIKGFNSQGIIAIKNREVSPRM